MTIIIPRNFTNLKLRQNYFNPRYATVQKNEQVNWVNLDSTTHTLDFYKVHPDKYSEYILTIGPINPGDIGYTFFDPNFPRIDYVCREHGNEIGSIVTYPKPENEMTNTQQLQFLAKVFNIKFPPI